MPALSGEEQARILALLESASTVLGLRLCFHDNTRKSGLARAWQTHADAACQSVKDQNNDRNCSRFATIEVPLALAGTPDGRIHVCPFGYTELVVPVISDGLHAGVLFAGPCWTGDGPPTHPDLICPPDEQWLPDRLVLLRAVAHELGGLLEGKQVRTPSSRHQRILEFLQDTLREPVTLAELADELGLSPSRTGHLVRELFGTTFPRLVHSVKLREAARLLSSTDLTIGELALKVGFLDQNYFSRLFSRHFGMSPRKYRQQHPAEA